MFTIGDLVETMDLQENKLVLQNDANDDPEYTPYIFTDIEEFRGSDLYNQIASYDVTGLYSENDGTIWICYECDLTE